MNRWLAISVLALVGTALPAAGPALANGGNCTNTQLPQVNTDGPVQGLQVDPFPSAVRDLTTNFQPSTASAIRVFIPYAGGATGTYALQVVPPAGGTIDTWSSNLTAIIGDHSRFTGDTSHPLPLYVVGEHGNYSTVRGAWFGIIPPTVAGSPAYGGTVSYYAAGTGGLGIQGSFLLSRTAPFTTSAPAGNWSSFGGTTAGYGSNGGSLFGWQANASDVVLGASPFVSEIAEDGRAVNWRVPAAITNGTPAVALLDPSGLSAGLGAHTGGTSLIETLSLTTSRSFELAVYLEDFGNRGRSEQVSVTDRVGNQNLTVSDLSGGRWVVFHVAGDQANPVTLGLRSWTSLPPVASAVLID